MGKEKSVGWEFGKVIRDRNCYTKEEYSNEETL